MSTTKAFRDLLAQNDIIRAPGVYDGITARIVEQNGFPAVYMTGAGTSMSLGYPDFGLVTQTEICLLYTSPSPRDRTRSRMPSSA